MRHWAFVVAFLALVVSLFSSATAQNSRRSLTFTSSLPSYAPPIASALPSRFRPPSAVAQVPTPTPTPGFIPWYYPASPWPAPVASANAAIGGVFGAANIYNSGTSPLTTAPPGTGLLSVLGCYFICYGAPGYASHHVFAYGNDLGETSYTSQGAPDDCDEPGFHHCPAGVHDQIFSITLNDYSGAPNAGYFLALDGNSDLGVFGTIAAGGAIVAGAGNGTPAPSPAAGALVSHTCERQGRASSRKLRRLRNLWLWCSDERYAYLRPPGCCKRPDRFNRRCPAERLRRWICSGGLPWWDSFRASADSQRKLPRR